MWYKKKWGTDKICGITQSRLRPGKDQEGNTYVIRTHCGHGFYRKALLEWIDRGNKSCPICRENIQ